MLIGAYISFGGIIIGVLLAGPITYYYSRKLIQETHKNTIEVIRITEHNKAIADFRASFAPAIAFLYLAKKHKIPSDKGISPSDVDKFLRNAILNHAAAIEKFRIFITKDKGTAYQEAWEKYRYEVCNYGFDTTCFRTDIKDPYEMFEDLIQAIIQFTELKNN